MTMGLIAYFLPTLIFYVFMAWCGWKIARSLAKMVALLEDYLQRLDHTLATFPVGYLDRARERDAGSE